MHLQSILIFSKFIFYNVCYDIYNYTKHVYKKTTTLMSYLMFLFGLWNLDSSSTYIIQDQFVFVD